MHMPRGYVAHLDADCFYASAERVRHPSMDRKPIGVIGNQGACVIAKSYEMKAKGVKTGEPIWDAIVKCPEGIYVKRDFAWYGVLSRLMLETVQRYSPTVEYYSIDESFFLLESASEAKLREQATRIRDAIKTEHRLPVTIGVARTRTLAKLASDTAKPFGVAILADPEAEKKLLDRLPAQEITGIGGRRAETLACFGIRTCSDFARANPKLILKQLTITGAKLHAEINGEQVIPLDTVRPPHKMLSRGGSMGGKIRDLDILHAWMVRNLERLVEVLFFHQVFAAKLEIALSHSEAPSTIGTAALDGATDRFPDLLEACNRALKRAYQPGWPVTHQHIIATRLERAGNKQRSLFETDDERDETIAKAVRDINQRHGRFKVRSAATLRLPQIYADPANDDEICDIPGKKCF